MSTLRMGTIALALTMIGVVYSQDKKPNDKPPVKLTGRLPQNYKKLGLRDDQLQRIYKIRADAKAKGDELKAKLDKLKADERVQLEKVLTPEQLKRLREIRSGDKPTEK
jgi:hypothetical protein